MGRSRGHLCCSTSSSLQGGRPHVPPSSSFMAGDLLGATAPSASTQQRSLAQAGYVAFSIGYRLFDRVGLAPTPGRPNWMTFSRPSAWVRANAATYGVDPERIGAYGHSSGGTLAAMLGVLETRDDSDPALAGISSRVTCVVTLARELGSEHLPPPAVMATFERAAQ